MRGTPEDANTQPKGTEGTAAAFLLRKQEEFFRMNSQPQVLRALNDTSASAARSERAQRLSVKWLRIIGICLIVLTVLALGAMLALTRTVVMPIVAGIVIGLIMGPLGDRARRYKVPPGLTYTVLVVGFSAGLMVLASSLMPALDTFSTLVPQIKERLASLSSHFAQGFGAANLFSGAASLSFSGIDQATVIDWAGRAVSLLTPALSQLLIFLFTLILFLAGRDEIRRSVTMSVKGREKRLMLLKTYSNVENRLTDYFVVVSFVNLVLAGLVGLSFFILDVPGPMRWAMMVFLLNFLPVVGPLMIKGALVIYALLFAPTLFDGLMPLLVFFALSLVEANLVTPRVVGTRMTLNPLLVFISVIFWTWLWGFPGAFLAMPFLAIASAVHAEYGKERGPFLPG
ncbi:MAG: AI-2E family transporter [Proteobacteria bacterium]|nr:AI-2E family transporter [Pseudomonadota bacterium]